MLANQRAIDIFERNINIGVPVTCILIKTGGFQKKVKKWRWLLNYAGQAVHIETYNIAVATYNQSGELRSSYIIPKILAGYRTSWVMAGFWNQYKRFAYINGNERAYC